ncbi:MAG: alpha-amylase family glycosyl hydrolase [Myxococcaceae bacterium]
MVLSTRPLLAVIAVAAMGACAAGCIHGPPQLRAQENIPVAVAYVLDNEQSRSVQDVPDSLKEAVAAALAERNLLAEPVPFERYREAFTQVRSTQRRFELIEENTTAPLVLLVETKPSFFSRSGGRYRWTVLAQVTAQPRKEGARPASDTVSEAVILMYDHEREPEAVTGAARQIAKRAGGLFDELLAQPGMGGVPTSQRPGTGAIYFVMVDRFANGDPSNDGKIDLKDPAAFHGGDLAGVISKLDELKALGVETLWLSPVFKMRTEKFYGYGAFHGYWVEDLHQIEPRFGDEATLTRLSDELHRRGMKLVLDIVLNHVGPDTRLVTEKPHWFHRKGALEKWDDPEQLVSHDVHGLPDLAQDRPEVYQYLIDGALKWIRVAKPDGFRLDAVKHMPLSFWRRFNQDIRRHAGEDFLLLGEMLEGDASVLARTQREGGFNSIFDFPLHFAVNDVFCKGASPAKLAAVMSTDRLYEDASALVPVVDNHDLPRLMSTCGGDLEKAKQALFFTLTARGTPSFIWGTEVGLTGAKEPENRGDMVFEDHPLRHFIGKTLALRRAHPSLSEGVPLLLEVASDRLIYARVVNTELAVFVVNGSDRAWTFKTPAALPIGLEWIPAEGSERVVPARGTRVFFASGSDFGELHARAMAEWKGTAVTRKVALPLEGIAARADDTILVVGSGPELGGWNPEKAPAVPAGRTHIDLSLPAGAAYELKLVVRRKSGELIWESGPNRTLFVSAHAEVQP